MNPRDLNHWNVENGMGGGKVEFGRIFVKVNKQRFGSG